MYTQAIVFIDYIEQQILSFYLDGQHLTQINWLRNCISTAVSVNFAADFGSVLNLSKASFLELQEVLKYKCSH